MSTRISDIPLIAVLLMLAACDQQTAAPPPDPKAPDTVPCRVDGASAVAPLCRRENDGARLTIRHPGGGFRRFVVVDDGRGIVTADGSEAARIDVLDKDRIRVTVARDIYELPATIVAAR